MQNDRLGEFCVTMAVDAGADARGCRFGGLHFFNREYPVSRQVVPTLTVPNYPAVPGTSSVKRCVSPAHLSPE